jgi:hypothetical protein
VAFDREAGGSDVDDGLAGRVDDGVLGLDRRRPLAKISAGRVRTRRDTADAGLTAD